MGTIYYTSITLLAGALLGAPSPAPSAEVTSPQGAPQRQEVAALPAFGVPGQTRCQHFVGADSSICLTNEVDKGLREQVEKEVSRWRKK